MYVLIFQNSVSAGIDTPKASFKASVGFKNAKQKIEKSESAFLMTSAEQLHYL